MSPMAPHINIVHVVINEHGPIFAELIDLLTDSLQRLGLRVQLTTNRIQADALNLFVGHTAFLSPENFAVLKAARAPYIVFQMEALHQSTGFAAFVPRYLELLQGANAV